MPRKKIFKSEEDNSEINISPLLDMVFILLIFFVVTSTFVRETGVEVNKPKASSASQIKDKILKMAITREGAVHIHEKQVGLDELETILKREVTQNPLVKAIIVADEKAYMETLVAVLDRCNSVGITKTSIAATAD